MPTKTLLILTLAALCFAAHLRADEPPADFPERIRPILAANCVDCHNAETQEGGVNFAKLLDSKTPWQDRKLWRRAVRQIAAGSMPPDASGRTASMKTAATTGTVEATAGT